MDNQKGIAPTLIIPVQKIWIQASLDFVQTLLVELDFDKRLNIRVRLALEEMLTYLSRTALSDPEAEPLQLTIRPQIDKLEIQLFFKGLPLNLDHLPRFHLSEDIDEENAQGLSLHLVREMVDDLSFINRGREGMEIKMTVIRAQQHIEHRISESPAFEAIKPKDPEPLQYTIRKAEESDAFSISKAAYLSFGYTYYDYIYYPEQIIALQRAGLLHSIVFVKEDGEVIAHAAVKLMPNRMDTGEQGVVFIIPQYRKDYGLAPILGQALFDLAKNLGLESGFGQMLAGHLRSQKMGLKLGMKDCALLLGYKPRDTSLKGLGGEFRGKMGVLIQWAPFKPQRTRIIFPPGRYASLIQSMYEHLEIPFSLGDLSDGSNTSSIDPLLEVHRDRSKNIAKIHVPIIGSDPSSVARWTLKSCRDLFREKFDVIYLSVNLQEYGASILAEQCAQGGFIFSGVMPDAFQGKDGLVMQYMNMPENPFDGLELASEMANRIGKAIQEEFEATAG